MRSSPSKADPLDPGRMGFAHRGLHYGAALPENSVIAFAAALEIGAGIECDLRLSADNRIVVLHDADAWRMCASPLRIGQSTMSELARLRVGEHPIPTLQALLSLVAGRVPLLLEIKVDKDVWRWMPALRRDLAGYEGRFGIMSFDPRLPRLLKTNMPEVRRGLVVRDGLTLPRRLLAMWLADPQFIAVDKAALGKSWVAKARRALPIYSWTIGTAGERAQGEVHADALIWEGDGRPRN
ncbi:MAG: glycerophosphodiester phosphodiesterase family protein [Sphingomicrobium sp.]